MGVINVTPDSFSDGGAFLEPGAAVAHGMRLVAEGADILDVGGESTRPGAEAVPAEEQLRRVIPVIEGLRTRSDVLISIDTSNADVAAAAITAGADIINDVTGLRGARGTALSKSGKLRVMTGLGVGSDDRLELESDDDELEAGGADKLEACPTGRMAKVVADSGAGVVIMHMKGGPRNMQRKPVYDDVVREVREFFAGRLSAALSAGIAREAIVFDPGIGFGKTTAHNLELLRRLDELSPAADRPLLVGVSRKSFIGRVLGSDDAAERDWPTVALTSLAREKGARIIRVHEVLPNVQALRMTEAILDAGERFETC